MDLGADPCEGGGFDTAGSDKGSGKGRYVDMGVLRFEDDNEIASCEFWVEDPEQGNEGDFCPRATGDSPARPALNT